MTRNGQPCEAVGVVNLRSVGVIDSIQFYAFGRPIAEVVTGASETDITNGVFQLRISDYASQWQVVGARIDRQFWHGGVVTDSTDSINSSGSAATSGEQAVATVMIPSGGRFMYSVGGVAPLGGVWNDGIYICDGGQALSDFDVIEVNTPSFTPQYMTVKAIFVIDSDLFVKLRVLYPTDLVRPVIVPIFTEFGQDLRYDDTQSPWVLGEL